jgi:hypothetical protein
LTSPEAGFLPRRPRGTFGLAEEGLGVFTAKEPLHGSPVPRPAPGLRRLVRAPT